MLKKRNAQGLSITTIVVAIIGLIILVAIILMLTGKLGAFSTGVDKISGDIEKTCGELTGTLSDTVCASPKAPIVSKDTLATNKYCCK